MDSLALSNVKIPFSENYQLCVVYTPSTDQWTLSSLKIDYRTSTPAVEVPTYYQHAQEMVKTEAGEKSLAKRSLAGRGDSQPVNVTLELTTPDAQKIEQASAQCKVIIEEILPEWFFISYDDLHTVEKYEVFEI